MLEDAGDVVQRRVRQIGIFVAGKDRGRALPDRLVGMHARAVVAIDRLRHEGRCLAVGLRHLVDHIFVDLHRVGGLHQRAELDAELVLRGAHFVMVLLGDDAHVAHHRQHLGAEVLRRVDRRHREIAALGARPVAEIAHLVFGVGIGRQFHRVELEAAIERLGGEAHVVEHEELGLRSEHRRIADAGLLKIGLGLAGDRARVALVRFVGQGLKHVAEHGKRALREERVDHGRGGIGHQLHVRLVDHLPAGDRGAIEHDAVGERLLVHEFRVHRHVLHLAARVGEAQVDELDVFVLDCLGHTLCVCHRTPLSLA